MPDLEFFSIIEGRIKNREQITFCPTIICSLPRRSKISIENSLQREMGRIREKKFQTAVQAVADHAQEKPDFEEHPDNAPEGILLPPEASLKFEAEMVFFTWALPHFLQLTVSAPEVLTMVSKRVLQSLHLYS